MPIKSGSSSNSNLTNDIEIHLDLSSIRNALLKDPKFIDAVAKAVRNQLLKDARSMKTLFAQWGGNK
jgi:hypothetical protein